MGIILIKFKTQNNAFFFINYLIFLKKFKNSYLFNTIKQDKYKTYKLTTFFKKSNLYFKNNIFNKKILKKKIFKLNPKKYRVRGKKRVNLNKLYLNKNLYSDNKQPINKVKFYRLKDNFYKKIKLSINFLKNNF